MKKAISTNGAPAAIGPYSQAIDCGEFVFTSGQLGLDPATGKLADGGVQAQATQAMKNIQAVLTAAGLTLDNVVKTTVLLTNIADFAAVNEVYASFFEGTTYPARCAYQDHLPEVIAVLACIIPSFRLFCQRKAPVGPLI